MNDKQRENAAQSLYDLSKIVFMFTVVAHAVSTEFRLLTFWLGMIAPSVLFAFGYILDRGGQQ